MADAKVVVEAIEECRRWEDRCSVISQDMERARERGDKEMVQIMKDDLSHAQEQLSYYRALIKDMKEQVSSKGLGSMMSDFSTG
ncbi:MAG: hypothetical protein QCI38_04090 [Candidatus Thermoplasmatota archaeon]|nr:hypothetical protein [Candidatus Thermoplasmatota archaeon]